jgi:4-amino-4-deoxy-L-arabinose transferase-like glycosyltransferase
MILGRRMSLGVLLAFTVVLYAVRLDYSPIYMHDAEVQFALHARSIAATMRDSNGNFLPLYFRMPAIGPNVWFHPMLVYFTAMFLKVLRFSEWSVRFPSAIVGTADVALMYLVASRLFRNATYGSLAAFLLALTPAHFIHSRLAMDYIYPLPFVLLWLWCLLKFDEREQPWAIAAAGLALGIGFYSYIAAVVFMPLYLAFTWLFLFGKCRRLRLAHLTATVAFCVPLVFFVAWRIMYPEVFSGTAYRYAITRSGVVFGLLRLLNYNQIQEYVSLYWNFHNPTFLFFVSSPNFQSSTRAAGVYLMPVAIFLVAGLYDVAFGEKTRSGWLLLAGFLTAPIPAVLVEEPMAIYREMVVLPFAILIVTFGARRLLTSRRGLWRAVAVAALVLMPIQFGFFFQDYFTNYRLNAYVWFGGNVKGAVTRVLALDAERQVPSVYLGSSIPYGPERWHFYLATLGHEDFMTRTHPLDASSTTAALPSGSLIVVPTVESVVTDARMKFADVRKVAEIIEPFGAKPIAFVVFERQ